MTSNELTFKVLVIGESSVGKTAMLERYCENSFKEEFMPTIGMDFNTKTLVVNDKTVKLKIWDTAGQERFRNVTTAYYRGTMGCLVVYDVTNRASFEMLEYWIDEYQREQPHSEMVIVGNKCDSNEQAITPEMAETFAKTKNLKCIQCSARDGIRVKEAFELLATEICHNTVLMEETASEIKDSLIIDNPKDKSKKCC
ncbi:Rab family GTPase [Entamoeba marina]